MTTIGTFPSYGRDIFNDGDLDPMMPEVEGPEYVAQALTRRLDTERGSLLDDPDYGEPLEDFIGEGLDATNRALAPAKIAAELAKDDLVQSVRFVKLIENPGGVVDFQISVFVDETALDFVVGPDEVGRIILKGLG